MKSWISKVNFDLCEINLVHDVRDAETQQELEGFVNATKEQNLRLFQGHWGNPGGPRNEGIIQSSGHWIAFWDCDDIPNVQNVLNCLTKNLDADVHVGGFQVFDSDSEVVTKRTASEKIEDLYINPGLWRMIFRRGIIGKTVFPERLMGEDQNFLMNLRISSMKIDFHQEIFYNYFVGNSNQLTRQPRAIKDLRFSILDTCIFFVTADTQERKLVGIMLIKQYLSLMKRNPFLGILKPSLLMLVAFLRSPLIIIQSIMKVFRNIGGE
jgi:glycosyltransferase involved in cell wall biosynthesis